MYVYNAGKQRLKLIFNEEIVLKQGGEALMTNIFSRRFKIGGYTKPRELKLW